MVTKWSEFRGRTPEFPNPDVLFSDRNYRRRVNYTLRFGSRSGLDSFDMRSVASPFL
jgi:hypothetical protein